MKEGTCVWAPTRDQRRHTWWSKVCVLDDVMVRVLLVGDEGRYLCVGAYRGPGEAHLVVKGMCSWWRHGKGTLSRGWRKVLVCGRLQGTRWGTPGGQRYVFMMDVMVRVLLVGDEGRYLCVGAYRGPGEAHLVVKGMCSWWRHGKGTLSRGWRKVLVCGRLQGTRWGTPGGQRYVFMMTSW